MFSYSKKHLDGILSFRAHGPQTNGKDETVPLKPEEIHKARLSRRGGKLAFAEFSRMFGARLLDILPNIWSCMVGGLISAFQSGKWLSLPLATNAELE
jgi:TATA-binding protein-associated factor